MGLLQPLSIPDQKWDKNSMDLITGFPKVQGREYIYVVVDRLNKYFHFFSIPSEYNASQVTDLFLGRYSDSCGLSRIIVNNRDNRFLSTFWQDLFRLSGTKLTPSTSYHP
jgi:hypothetical protein